MKPDNVKCDVNMVTKTINLTYPNVKSFSKDCSSLLRSGMNRIPFKIMLADELKKAVRHSFNKGCIVGALGAVMVTHCLNDRKKVDK